MMDAPEDEVDADPIPNSNETKWRRFFRFLRLAPLSIWFALIVLAFYATLVVFAQVLAPYSETEIIGGAFLPPSAAHPMGTDALGVIGLDWVQMLSVAVGAGIMSLLTAIVATGIGDKGTTQLLREKP